MHEAVYHIFTTYEKNKVNVMDEMNLGKKGKPAAFSELRVIIFL